MNPNAQSPARCIVCDAEPFAEVRNGLPMRVCSECKLFWRATFDMPLSYYEQKDIGLAPGKLAARKRNVRDRASTLGRYTTLDDLCDIGCGEGMFLKELVDSGAQHVVGMEPGTDAADYARSLGLTVTNDPIEQLADAAAAHAPIRVYTLFHLIEHLPDPIGAIRLMRDALPAGGVVMIETPDFTSPSIVDAGYTNKLLYPEHLFYWNPQALARVLAREGFTVVGQGTRDFDRFRLPPAIALRRLGILPYRATGAAPATGEERSPLLKPSTEPGKSYIRDFVSIALSRAVAIFGRGEYLWVVARA